MLKIKRSISFVVEKPENKDDSAKKNDKKKSDVAVRVRCVVTWNSNRLRLSVNHKVNPYDWEPVLQRCKAKTMHGKFKTPASTINRDIDEMENVIDGIFREFEQSDKMPTKDELVNAYNRIVNPEDESQKSPSEQSIFTAFDEYVADGTRSGRWSASTQATAHTIYNHLRSINRNLTFKELEQMGVTGLLDYFATVPDNEKKRGLSNRTILKDISFIRSFLRWAIEHEYCEPIKLAEQKVKLKTAKKPVIFLEWDELMTLYNYNFGTKNNLNQIRDVFCFCCFTSLRYSDVYNLKKANISEDSITITTVKTNDTITIELNDYSRAILDKYKDVELPQGRALPVISNQKMNNHLKEIGWICGLDAPIAITTYKGAKRFDRVYKKWELLSTHVGRRTFVCNALMLGIPANIVMKWTGHSNYEAMRPYIEIADNTKKSAMDAFNNVEQKTGAKGGAKSGAKKRK